jgi:hypothetical protein
MLNIIIFIFREITIFIKFCWIRKKIFELLFENSLEDNFIKNDKNQAKNNINININSISNNNIRYEPFNRFKEFDRGPLYERRKFYGNRISHQALGAFIIRNKNTKEITQNKSNLSLSNLSNSNYGLNLEFKVINKNIKKTEIINKHPRNIISKKRISKTVIQNYNNNYLRKNLYLKKQKKTLFPFIFYILDLLINRTSGKNQFCIVSKDYLIVYKFINKVYDITSFLILYKQFNIFKNIFAKGKLLDIINTSTKMNIKNKDLNEELSLNSLNNVFQTFSELLLKEQNY